MTNMTNGTDLSGVKTDITADANKIMDAAGNVIKEMYNRSGSLVDASGQLITRVYDEYGKLILESKRITKESLDAIRAANEEELAIRARGLKFKGADEAVGESQDYIRDAYKDKLSKQAKGMSEVVDGKTENYENKRINEIDKKLIENELTLRISNLDTELASKKRDLVDLDIKKARVEADIEILSQKHKSYKKLYKAARVLNMIFWPALGAILGVVAGYLIVLFA